MEDSKQEDEAEAKEDNRGEELSLEEFSVVADEAVAEEEHHSVTGAMVGGTLLLTALPFYSRSSRHIREEGVEPKVRVREVEAARCRSTSRGSLLELAEEEDLHGLQQSSSSSQGTLSSKGPRFPMPPLFIHRETSRAQAPRATAWADREPQSRWFNARD